MENTFSRNSFLMISTGNSGICQKTPVESNPPFVVNICRWGFHRAYSPKVCMETIMPGWISLSSHAARMISFIVFAAHNDNAPSNCRFRANAFRRIFGMLNTSWQWGTSSSSVFTTQSPHRITRTWWQLGQKYRPLQENATRKSFLQLSQYTRQNPFSNRPQFKYLSTVSWTTGRNAPSRYSYRCSYSRQNASKWSSISW